MQNLLKNLFKKYSIEHTDLQIEKLAKYYEMVIVANEKFNLTAITEKFDFAVKHFLDSVLPIVNIPKNATMIDVGAGAGFPSVPIKILRDDVKVVMLDSLNKRVNFLNDVVQTLGLKNISAVHARAEDYAGLKRESFDVCVARAVANLTTLSEYCLPFVKTGGKFIALKGSNLSEELKEAAYAIKTLGGTVLNIQKVFIEEIDSNRENVVIVKTSPTPAKYPRGKNLPRLKPLV